MLFPVLLLLLLLLLLFMDINLVSHTEGGTWAQDVQEMGEEENIWA